MSAKQMNQSRCLHPACYDAVLADKMTSPEWWRKFYAWKASKEFAWAMFLKQAGARKVAARVMLRCRELRRSSRAERSHHNSKISGEA